VKRVFPFLLLTLFLFSCASQREFRSFQSKVSSLEERVRSLEEEQKRTTEEIRKQLVDLITRLQALEYQWQNLSGLSTTQVQEREKLLKELNELREQLFALQERLALMKAGTQGAPSMDTDTPPPFSSEEAYNLAIKYIEEGKLEEGEKNLLKIVERGEKEKYFLNAHFWLGEIAYRKKNYPTALKYYLVVMEKDPRHPKTPPAYLKAGLALWEMGEKERAKKLWNDLVRLYPDTEQADHAKRLLKKN
jgi:tol-pal system protein YbgF